MTITPAGGRARGISYLLLGLAGLAVFIVTPRTIEHAIGGIATYIWGALLIPGLIAGIAATKAKWRWEYPILPLLIAGLAIYALTLWFMAIETPTRLAQTLIITAIAHKLIARFIDLRNLANTSDEPAPDDATDRG